LNIGEATAPTADQQVLRTHAGANVRQHRCAVRLNVATARRLPDQRGGVLGYRRKHSASLC
jgi:hypothetical protein